MIQQTFAMIKPDAIESGHLTNILACCHTQGLVIIALRMLQLSDTHARRLYQQHENQPWFERLIAHTVSGPVVAVVLEGHDAVQHLRRIMGSSDPRQAEPGSLRARFGSGMPANGIHGSESAEAAAREISLFFSKVQIFPKPSPSPRHVQTAIQPAA
jgi:nucleoside-diphosphate kinase